MPRTPPLPAIERKMIRELARAQLIARFRLDGDIEGVEILLGHPLPEIERWAIVESRIQAKRTRP